MVYTDPDTFQSYIDEYNATGSEEAKQQALKHFTIERGYIASNYGSGTTISAGTVLTYHLDWDLYIITWGGKPLQARRHSNIN